MEDFKLILDGLYRISYKNEKSTDIINEIAKKVEDISYITKNIYGVLENKLYLEYILTKLSKIKVKKLDKKVKLILLIGIYNIHFLDRKNYAIVNELVNLTKKVSFKSKSFVNAILRSYIRDEKNLSKINIENDEKRIGITRAHLEEDAGKNTHEAGHSLVDLNRSGTPLLEIVSEPDMRNSDEAVAYLKKLHSILRFLNISDANMQEGSFRCDVNVSIRPKGENKLYTRVEIKNLNSFKFIQKAIDYEVARQCEAWEDGKYEVEVVQETRLFDTTKGATRSMRGKEEAADYRYFPEPDLLPVYIDEKLMSEGRAIPEMPDEKCVRYCTELGLKEADARVLISSVELARYFEQMLESGVSAKGAQNWLTNELLGRLKGENTIESCGIDSKTLSVLVARVEGGQISGKSGKEILDVLVAQKGGDVDKLIESLGLAQVNDDSALISAIDSVLSANPDKISEYKAGKDKLFSFFVGQVMKNAKGANPVRVNELLKEKLQ